MKVLVAEDSAKVRDLAAEILGRAGFEVLLARTGLEALRIAQDAQPEVVLLDGLMPEMHGFEVARFIKINSGPRKPHIVVMTAIYRDNRYQNEAKLRWGVDRYIIKPLTEEKLLEAITGTHQSPNFDADESHSTRLQAL